MDKMINSDEQAQQNSVLKAIQWVGITQVQSYIKTDLFSVAAEVDLTVDLKSGYRGIHMSRLYSLINDKITGSMVSYENLDQFLKQAIESQEGLSNQAKCFIRFEWPMKTVALKSKTQGFRKYPVSLKIKKKLNDQSAVSSSVLTVEFKIIYSSTCPQSSKLAKEYFKNEIKTSEQLQSWFDSDQIYLATPHAQRSELTVQLQFTKGTDLNLDQWIHEIEMVLGTPVQTSVKKADEMEFARLNAENTMFCEDAIRKVADHLDSKAVCSGYRLTVKHLESLHPHNAFSQLSHQFFM